MECKVAKYSDGAEEHERIEIEIDLLEAMSLPGSAVDLYDTLTRTAIEEAKDLLKQYESYSTHIFLAPKDKFVIVIQQVM